MSLIGFEDGKAFVELSDIECVDIINPGNQWNIQVTVRHNTGATSKYVIYEGQSEPDAKKHLDSFVKDISGVVIIKSD